jgi:RNA polymerase sigma-70 factor (ECF subfamily)
MSLPHTDPEVVRAAATGDDAAWQHLTGLWLPVVLCWCRRLAGPDVDAEDLAHDVWLKLYQRIGQLRAADAFGSWAYRVTRDTVRKQRERRQRWANVRALLPLRARAETVHRDVAAGETVLRLLQKLPEPQREALVLCFIEDRTREEAAQLAGVPLGTMKSRLRTATARFRSLAEHAGLVDAEPEVSAWRS